MKMIRRHRKLSTYTFLAPFNTFRKPLTGEGSFNFEVGLIRVFVHVKKKRNMEQRKEIIGHTVAVSTILLCQCLTYLTI